MKKIVSVLALLTGLLLNAQFGAARWSSTASPDSRWTLGGTAGVSGSFGQGRGWGLYLAPRVGYLVSESMEAGITGNLSYNSFTDGSATMLGLGPFATYYFGRNVFVSGNFQQYYIRDCFTDYLGQSQSQNFSQSALYLGGGYLQSLGPRTYMQIGAMYNVLHNQDSRIGAFVPQVGLVYGL